MKRGIERLVLFIGTVLGATAVAGSLEDATAAYVRGDYATALPLFRSLGDQGYPTAQINLGYMCANGRGVVKDDADAVKWFRKAAEQGDARGQNELGFMYREGRGVTRDDAAAVAWFHKAVELGLADAQVNLGSMDEQGRGVAKDQTEAVTWHRKAAEQGNVTAQGNLRQILSSQTVTNGAKGDAAVASGIVTADTSTCKLVRIDEWQVRLTHNRPIVDGAINGQKIGVMLDTGSTNTLIARSAVARLGLTQREVRGHRMVSVGGETHVAAALVDEFTIGQRTRKGWRMLVAGERDVGDDVAVLIGEDFFRHFDVEFDLAHNAVRLYQPKDCDGVSLAYWATDGVGETEIEAVYDAEPQILLTVQINGQPVRAQLDSGAGMSVLAKSDAARLGVTPETPGVVALGSWFGLGATGVTGWIGPFARFAIGNEVIRDTTIHFADLWKDATYTTSDSRIPKHVAGQPMLLGADFLRAHRLLVAHSQRKLYFTFAGGPVFRRPNQVPATVTDAKPTTTQPTIPAKTK